MIGAISAHYVEASGPAGADLAAYKAAVLADSPWAAWDLTEAAGATQYADYSPNARPFDITGTPTPLATGGPLGAPAVDWPATTTDYAKTAAGFAIRSATLEAWVYLAANPSGLITILGNGNTFNTTGTELGMGLTATGRVRLQIFANGAGRTLDSTDPLSLGAWHHVVGTFSSTTGMRIRIDKAPQGALAQNTTYDLNRVLWLHGAGLNSTAQAFRVALPAAYGTSLTDARIDAHYDAL